MTLFSYNNNVPNPPNDPGDDVGDMNQNTQSINGIIAQDHVGFNLVDGGYHTVIHQKNQTINGQSAWIPNNPGIIAAIKATKISGVQQIFPLLYTPDTSVTEQDTQLFSMTGKGGISQLTGNLASSDGWAWLGGILLQWGTIPVTPGSWPTAIQTQAFKDRVVGCIPFPNSCFLVLTNFNGPATNTNSDKATLTIISKTRLQFQWLFCPSSSSDATFTGFSWIAIGN